MMTEGIPMSISEGEKRVWWQFLQFLRRDMGDGKEELEMKSYP